MDLSRRLLLAGSSCGALIAIGSGVRAALAASVGSEDAATGGGGPGRAKLSRADRIAGNLAIAQRFNDGYHRAVERGRVENVFVKEDFADQWIFCSPYIGGEKVNTEVERAAYEKGAPANHARISQKIIGYKEDDFRAWPTENGCAWRWRFNGRGTDGHPYSFWEQIFLWTNDECKITRFEFYDEWHGFPQAMAFADGKTLDEDTKVAHYGAAPWTPPPKLTYSRIPSSPAQEPPANGRVKRNLELAKTFFDALHTAAKRGRVSNLFSKDNFAEGWILFSPWFGEIKQSHDSIPPKLINALYRKIWKRLPDYNVDQFEAWPTDNGCAWRWCVNGHSAEGVYYEFWEQVFIDTNEDGKITRLEFFDDWKGFPQTLGFITDLTVGELWDVRNFRTWIDK